jgi:tetratricopeptide (TPR) repeat protein
LLALPIALAQKNTVVASADSARASLAQKARALEARGRPDIAIQLWQQILLSAPNDTAALAGLAKDYKLIGSNDLAGQALDRLRKINPHDPNIARNQSQPGTTAESDQPRQAKQNEAKPLEARPLEARPLEAKPPETNTPIARNLAERAAFAALNAHNIDEAEKRFSELLQSEPNNGRVEAGMGFLRMQQKNFSEAINYFTLAAQHGYNPKSIDDALSSSRFFLALAEGAQAFNANHLDVAQTKFRAALDMDQRSTDAMSGLAGVYVKQEQYLAAAGIYDELIRVQPSSFEGWRGLFLSCARSNQNDKALALTARMPPSVTSALNKDPDYLRTLAGIHQSQGRDADAQRVLDLALALPFPGNGSTLEAGTKMQYAGILMEARRYPQAIALYTQLVTADPANVPAWMGLISAEHELGQDTLAIVDIEKMPPSVYESSLTNSDFLSLLGAIYQQANHYDVAQGMLERAQKLAVSSGAQPSVKLQLQLAGIYLLRKNTDQAYPIYRQLIAGHPDNADAWKGVVASLAAENRNGPALQQIEQMPAAVRKHLDNDIAFIQTAAGVYVATGDTARAWRFMNRVLAYYAKAKQPPSPAIDIQNTWLLYNIGNDRALYPALMRIGGRTDLTIAQRETVQEIWASWSVRRAAAAIENGDATRAIDILDAASLAFPNNLNVRKAVAGGYARVGRAKKALALYKSIPMQNAAAGDFQGAVGAALAANDKAQAEAWLRQALDRFPHDPAILSVAAQFEQARGDNERAADYYRASLAAMPPVTPAERLAHALVFPEQDTRPHRAVTAADLQRLLDPANEPFAKTTRLPPLPPYGPDPYESPAPVATPEQQPSPQSPQSTAPTPQIHPAVNLVPQSLHLTPRQIYLLSSRAEIAKRSQSRDLHFRFVRSSANWGAPHLNFEMRESTNSMHALSSRATEGSRGICGYSCFPKSPYTIKSTVNPNSPHLLYASLALTRPAHKIHPALQATDAPDITLTPPHSLASDAWKGLVFSLIAANRNAEALRELSKVPPEIRFQLESDIEWVQGVASLYVAVGDTPHASAYLKRVDDFYLVHRTELPVAIEIQHARLLYNIRSDAALYPVLQRLDARTDLSPADRQQIGALWIDWAIRRATDDLNAGYLQHGVQILQAAALQFADSMLVRRALAGAYIRAGQPQQALSVYKTIPMDSATPGDLVGAISAAMAAGDLATSESWLRLALARYSNDPQVLALAARFEQARGNTSTEFWRAALAAMPPGSDAKSLNNTVAPVTAPYPAPASDLHRLLDPRFNSGATPEQVAPLPSYKSPLTSSTYSTQFPAADLSQHTMPSGNPLPLPTAEQGSNASAPALIEQSNTTSAPPTNAGYFATPSAPQVYTGLEANSASDRSLEMPQTSAPVTTAALAPAPTLNLPIVPQPIESAAPPPPAPQPSIAPAQLAPRPLPVEIAANNDQAPPSVRDAVTGAYSAPQQVRPALQPASEAATTSTKPRAGTPIHTRPRAKPAAQPSSTQSSETITDQAPTQTLGNAQIATSASPENSTTAPESSGNSTQSSSDLTDEELAQNLPPLHGPWIRFQRGANPPSPRELAEEQLRAIESGYSGWLGGTSTLNYRSGTPGYSQLAAIEAPFEAATPLGAHARLAAVAKPVFLDSGAAGISATLAVIESTGSGTARFTIPEPIGTLTSANLTPPPPQSAFGLGGELQLIFQHLAIAGGYTPSNFLVSTFTGRFNWRPANGPLTLNLSRDSVKDSQLSYAGLRDPAGNTLTTRGEIWGAVVANQAQVQFDRGDAQSGLYFSAGGQYLTGYNTESNTRVDGAAGAYWRAFTSPEYGELNIGANFFAMHYANNQNAFTLGMGGYFSPQAYFLANAPFNWTGHWQTHLHYTITGALGVQGFQQDSTPLWPLAAQKALEVSQNNPMLPALTSVGLNYDLKSEVAYQLRPHWLAGINVAANNTRNYNFASVGFFIRYTFREQPAAVTSPTGLFPTDGFRPFTVP